MLELESRIIAASVVQAVREQGEDVREIHVEPHPSGGIRLRASFSPSRLVTSRDGWEHLSSGPVVQCDIPPGFFSYGQVATALIQATGRCQREVK